MFIFYFNYNDFDVFSSKKAICRKYILGQWYFYGRKKKLQVRFLAWRRCAQRHCTLYYSSAHLRRRKSIPPHLRKKRYLTNAAFSFFQKRARHIIKSRRGLNCLPPKFSKERDVWCFMRFCIKEMSPFLSRDKNRRNKKATLDDDVDIKPMPWW